MLLFVGEWFGELPKDNSSSAGISGLSGTMGFFPLSSASGTLLVCSLTCLLRQDCVFSLPGPKDDRFHAVSVQHDPEIPSSALLVPPTSSPYLDANAGIVLQATESSDCSTLQLCHMNQMWGGELSELLVAKGY